MVKLLVFVTLLAVVATISAHVSHHNRSKASSFTTDRFFLTILLLKFNSGSNERWPKIQNNAIQTTMCRRIENLPGGHEQNEVRWSVCQFKPKLQGNIQFSIAHFRSVSFLKPKLIIIMPRQNCFCHFAVFR